jgi:hypothetical protein
MDRVRATCRFYFEASTCYEDGGLLHWLSRVVWGKSQHEWSNDHVEVVRLQVAFELFKQQLLPPEQSFLSLIAQQQKPVGVEIKCGGGA